MIDLAEVFPREEARAPGAATWVIDLGRRPYSRDPGSGDPGGVSGVGLGFPGLDSSWVKDDLSPPLAAALEVWSAAEQAWMEQTRGAYLLEQRANLLRAVPPGDEGFALRCAIAARTTALDLARAHDVAARDAAARLVALLDARAAKTVAERLLLGCLLADRTMHRVDAARPARARSLELLASVANDPRAPRRLRALAAEQVAGELDDSQGAARLAALRQVLALTSDPEQRIETLIKLADLAPRKPAEQEKQLEQILAELGRRPASYRAAIAWSKLARLRLDRGAFALARDAATQCARATSEDQLESPDPWGCAPLLADALDALGGASPGAEVPLSFLGPLAFQIMSRSIARLDRDEARRAGELLLARAPMAADAPQALDLLISLSSDAQARSALLARRERDSGPGSDWYAAQRARLAPSNALPELDKALSRLVQPPRHLGKPAPTTEEQRRAELTQRLEQVLRGCDRELAASGREITLRIDTTGSLPKATTVGANEKLAACLAGLAASSFRSVGPARISAVLFGE